MITPKRTQKPPLPKCQFYTVKEFAALTGMGESTLYRHIREGKFTGPHYKSHTTYRISKVWADRLAAGVTTDR